MAINEKTIHFCLHSRLHLQSVCLNREAVSMYICFSCMHPGGDSIAVTHSAPSPWFWMERFSCHDGVLECTRYDSFQTILDGAVIVSSLKIQIPSCLFIGKKENEWLDSCVYPKVSTGGALNFTLHGKTRGYERIPCQCEWVWEVVSASAPVSSKSVCFLVMSWGIPQIVAECCPPLMAVWKQGTLQPVPLANLVLYQLLIRSHFLLALSTSSCAMSPLSPLLL